jgi:hypothetical protein
LFEIDISACVNSSNILPSLPYTPVICTSESRNCGSNWFDEYDSIHYSLENKLINYNKSQVRQLKEKSDWENDYILKDIVETYGLDETE